MAKRAMDGMLPHTGVPKHTHWSHKLPNRWLLCAWLVAISSAVWCSCAKQVGPWFCWNLCSSIWCLLAQRAERQRLPKQGWINRARLVGSKRVRGAWQKKGRQSRRRRAYRVALWIGLVLFGSYMRQDRCFSYVEGQLPPRVWSISRKKRNRWMHAKNGNPAYTPKKRKAYRHGVAEAHGSDMYFTEPADVASDGNREAMNRGMHVKNGNSAYTPKKRKAYRHGVAEAHGSDMYFTELADVTADGNREAMAAESGRGSLSEKKTRRSELADPRQQRIGDSIVEVPGDGWCFFHAVGRYSTQDPGWAKLRAAEIYLQALEWLLQARTGPRADEVVIACTPENELELQKHKEFVAKHTGSFGSSAWTDADILLWSKVLAVLTKPNVLDSIHHGSVVEIWALTQAFDFECLVWDPRENQNVWIRTMEQISDEAARHKLATHPNMLEIVHRDLGITGHYDMVQRSQHVGATFPVTPLLRTWRHHGAQQVLQQVRAMFPAIEPVALPPRAEAPSQQASSSRTNKQRVTKSTLGTQPCARPKEGLRQESTSVQAIQLQRHPAHGASDREADEGCLTSTTIVPATGNVPVTDRVADGGGVQATGMPASDCVADGGCVDPIDSRAKCVVTSTPPTQACEEELAKQRRQTEGSDDDAADEDATDIDQDSVVSWDSDASVSSNALDEGLQVDQARQWQTLEDYEAEVTASLTSQLRAKPLLPPCLEGMDSAAWDSMSGVPYPTSHCAIQGCNWCSSAEPCAPNHDKTQTWRVENLKWMHPEKLCCSDASRCLWAHLRCSHAKLFPEAEPCEIPSQYLDALYRKEDQSVPEVGWSVDRRTFRRMAATLTEENMVGLCCACCARTHVAGPNGEVGYVSVEDLFPELTSDSFRANWCYFAYKKNYAAHPAIKKRLAEKEWVRYVAGYGEILCCPEDIQCQKCAPDAHHLCNSCNIPVCRSCLTRMTQRTHSAIAQALTNDNWLGYPTELLYEHKVRWIEAAAACPVWTSMVSFYLEQDRGHVMDVDMHRADHRIAVRGNVSSFSMPWEEILATLTQKNAGHKHWGTLPHSKDTLRSLVKVTVKGMRHNEAIQWVSGAKIRPWVVTALLHHLIDLQHPMCNSSDSPEMAKEKVTERVTLAYGQEETEPLVQTEPESCHMSAANSVAARDRTSNQATPTKHATPELSSGTSLTGEAFTGTLRPNILSQDYTGNQVHDAEVGLVANLASTTDNMCVETGHSFWDQWKNDFVHWAFPFSLPAPTSGPDFPQKPRPRRTADAPMFTPLAHLKHLTGRIESSVRNSWDLVPGMRRITAKWDSVWGGNLWRKWQTNRKNIEAVPVSEWVQAAQGLYKKLRQGKYISADGRERPIQYDTRKLYYAKGLTKPEKQLLEDVRSMQTTVPGTIEARRRIGRFLFGARVELGEPLFVTISPTTRHNALCLKLSRYRVADPGKGPCSGVNVPPLWEAVSAEVDAPGYDLRREITARDPWAVVLSFQTIVRLIFAQLLGIRMCFRCPNCECRDARGHASHHTGGVLGLVRGLCGAIEYQANSTPHFHCNVFLASIWQEPLSRLLEKIQQKEITFQQIIRFQSWIHNESHPLPEQHQLHLKTLEEDWKNNFCQAKHNRLCHWPKFLQKDVAPSPWIQPVSQADVVQDATAFVASYASAVQAKFSTQQYHWHPWDPRQQCRLPLAGCTKKGCPNKCKHGFPKPLNWLVRVVCRGNARKHRCSTQGRRNSLGQTLGKRDDPYGCPAR